MVKKTEEPNLPQHVVCVPDGNRRWARAHGLPVFMGHKKGVNAFRTIAEEGLRRRIPYMTFWGCSVANITERSPKEVAFLFRIFEAYFKKLAKSSLIHKNKVRVEVLGRWREFFPPSLRRAAEAAIRATAAYGDYHLTLLMAYDGRDEMQAAVKKVVARAKREPEIVVTKELIKTSLWTKDLPPVDLVIRTGGEPHWSAGLLMWDVAEARLYFTRVFWPAFSKKEFGEALEEYSRTERRYGK